MSGANPPSSVERLQSYFWSLSLKFSLWLLIFTYGYCVGQYHWFPYLLIRDAGYAYSALVRAQTEEEPQVGSLRSEIKSPTTIWHRERDNSELILFSAGSTKIKTLHPDGLLASLIDRNGQVIHAWHASPDLWSDLNRVNRVPGVSGAVGPVCVYVYDNGDLLATFHGMNTFPFSVGIAKFDKKSNLLWKKENFAHHNFSITSEGHILVPALEIVDSPIMVGDTSGEIESPTGKIYRDQILELDADGNELSRRDVLQILIDSGWSGQLFRSNDLVYLTDDPLHLNDVRPAGPELAAQFDWLHRDDLIISLRNLNCLAIVDRETNKIKWHSIGTTIGQHSPVPWRDGLLVFDNLGGKSDQGGTRLAFISLGDTKPETVFPKRHSEMFDYVTTQNSGFLDVSSDGTRALMTLTHTGCLWEVDLADQQINWEYIAGTDIIPEKRLKIGSARYIASPSFLSAPSDN